MVNDKRAARAGALAAQDWIEAAGRAIVEGGVGAVAVEPLARRLGGTKGSFYWHFPNRDALLKATLEWWEQEHTETVIALVEPITDPRERRGRLIFEATRGPRPLRRGAAARERRAQPVVEAAAAKRLVGTDPESAGFLSRDFERAVSDAADHPIVRPVLQRVSERRIDYLAACYRALGLPADEARHRALVAYAAYLGTLRLDREVPSRMPRGEEYGGYQRHLVAALVPEREITGADGTEQG